MNVDYISLARERRLLALNPARQQPCLPGMDQPKLAPHPDDVTSKPQSKPKRARARIVYYLGHN